MKSFQSKVRNTPINNKNLLINTFDRWIIASSSGRKLILEASHLFVLVKPYITPAWRKQISIQICFVFENTKDKYLAVWLEK